MEAREDWLFPEADFSSEVKPPRPINRRRPRLAARADEPWRQGWDLTEEEIAFFRERSIVSAEAKRLALNGKGRRPLHPVNVPLLNPVDLMPPLLASGLRSLSLFSGGGGLDLGFELAGFEHLASFDILGVAGETLSGNRPRWQVYAGVEEGDVCKHDFSRFRGKVDVIHGGPPCQPFSMAGRQLGAVDHRNMFPTFVTAVLASRPRAFVAENVAALAQSKFRPFLDEAVFKPLSGVYHIKQFELKAEWFGVPQRRTRLFLVGFRNRRDFQAFRPPEPTHSFTPPKTNSEADLFGEGNEATCSLQGTMGVREALGLPALGFDDLAPTLRSGFTGPRGATSVNSSVSALRAWTRLGIWPNGVARDRHAAHLFVPENGCFRLSVQDAGLLQGFPESWVFSGPVYAVLGQIGNSVTPPMAYQVASAIRRALDS